MKSRRVLHSVGIDIGTTTTQVIFSQLELVNRAPASQVPHYEFTRREIIYVSPVVFTPLDANGNVNQVELMHFIQSQYQAAGLDVATVESGAIIITGETSKAKNARLTIMELAKTLGDFVVATAGPHLESIIAGQGSGAYTYSKEHACRVLNIDIGGGTSNYVVFENGRVVDSACLNVGGHLVETFEDGRIKAVREPARIMARHCFGAGVDPMRMTRAQLDSLMRFMAQMIVEVMQATPSQATRELLMTDCLKTHASYAQIFISGGVGECFYAPQQIVNPFMYGDTGPLLAQALHQQTALTTLATVKPKQTVRATVIGAGAYTLSLSGSTIWLSASHLPIQNVPVLKPHVQWHTDAVAQLLSAWQLAAQRMDLDLNNDLYALSVPDDMAVTYKEVLAVVQALTMFNAQYPNPKYPLLVMAKQDLGKVLGMELQPVLRGRELAVIDEVDTKEGDFVDIGKPFFGGEIVPLTVKSLAFPS